MHPFEVKAKQTHPYQWQFDYNSVCFFLWPLSVFLADDQRWRSDAGVSLLPVLFQSPKNRGIAALACPGNIWHHRGRRLTWLGVCNQEIITTWITKRRNAGCNVTADHNRIIMSIAETLMLFVLRSEMVEPVRDLILLTLLLLSWPCYSIDAF